MHRSDACLTYPVLVAAGSVRDTLLSSLISLPPSLLIIYLCRIEAVAASALLMLPFQAAVAIYYLGRHLDLRLADFVQATQKSGMVALCSCAAVAICAALVEQGLIGPVVGILVACATGAAVWLAALFAVQHPLLLELRALVSRVLSAVGRFTGRVPAMPIAKHVQLGRDVRSFHPDLVNLYGCSIGDETRLGTFVDRCPL